MMQKTKQLTRSPTLQTILMVERFLQQHRDVPISVAELRRQLPKQVMHQTLKSILEYLWKSGKILYGPRGIQWIYGNREHIDKMLEHSLEL